MVRADTEGCIGAEADDGVDNGKDQDHSHTRERLLTAAGSKSTTPFGPT